MKKFKNPYVVIMVGTPLSGKSTVIKKKFPDAGVISRDEIILETHGSRNYNLAYEEVNHKTVDQELRDRLTAAGKGKENWVIDMTHMSPKRRKYNLSFFPDHFKVCVVMDFITEKEYEVRNAKRVLEEDKFISWKTVENMASDYKSPSKEEGFNKIIFL